MSGYDARSGPPRNPWVEQQLAAGMQKEQIIAALRAQGWSQGEAWAVVNPSTEAERGSTEVLRPPRNELVPALPATWLAALGSAVAYEALIFAATSRDFGVLGNAAVQLVLVCGCWFVGGLSGWVLARRAGGPVPASLRRTAAFFAVTGMVLVRAIMDSNEFQHLATDHHQTWMRAGWVLWGFINPGYLVMLALAGLGAYHYAGQQRA